MSTFKHSNEHHSSELVHVFPINDLLEHETKDGSFCPCLPRVAEGGKMIIHNSYDARETGEICRRALDLLQSILQSGNPRILDPEEQETISHARDILNMHWPER